ncbi:hypothetical protein G7046_g7782 [Stylonectria norvegica]|nr:hypothetical protein G7046_g7782 [Stylonectria norvegica]
MSKADREYRGHEITAHGDVEVMFMASMPSWGSIPSRQAQALDQGTPPSQPRLDPWTALKGPAVWGKGGGEMTTRCRGLGCSVFGVFVQFAVFLYSAFLSWILGVSTLSWSLIGRCSSSNSSPAGPGIHDPCCRKRVGTLLDPPSPSCFPTPRFCLTDRGIGAAQLRARPPQSRRTAATIYGLSVYFIMWCPRVDAVEPGALAWRHGGGKFHGHGRLSFHVMLLLPLPLPPPFFDPLTAAVASRRRRLCAARLAQSGSSSDAV